jgi:hypothetical protein
MSISSKQFFRPISLDLDLDIDGLIREMEERIPELFIGTVCPGSDLMCDCIKVCKALASDPDRLTEVFTKSLLDNLAKV